MTRINLVDPSELTDQHLFAEFREIKMIPKSLLRSLRAAWQREFDKNDSNEAEEARQISAIHAVLSKIPKTFTLNTGHVSFFYNKGKYLYKRYELLKTELHKRGIKYNEFSEIDPDKFMLGHSSFWYDWEPTPEAVLIIRERIAEKIEMKVSWYRMNGCPLTTNPFKEWLRAN